jgi:hypothetical protein
MSSIFVPLSGAALWKHTVRVQALPPDTQAYLVLQPRM